MLLNSDICEMNLTRSNVRFVIAIVCEASESLTIEKDGQWAITGTENIQA